METYTLTITCPQSELKLTSDCGLSIPSDPNAQPDYCPTIRNYKAIWDTGASHCAITQKVVDDLNLTIKRPVQTSTANGLRDTYAYLVNICLPNNVMIPVRWATLSTLNGADILIGMDIISMGDFSVLRINEDVKFTFQLPPTHTIETDAERTDNSVTGME